MSAVLVAWDANPEEDQIDHYEVHVGPATGEYTDTHTVQEGTEFDIPVKQALQFAAVKAVNTQGAKSGFSNEVMILSQPSAPIIRIIWEIRVPQ